MKKNLVVLAILLIPYLTFGQGSQNPGQLAFKQFIGLYTVDQATVFDYLSLRNWEFEEAEKETDEDYAYLAWTFKRNKNNPSVMNARFSITYENHFDIKTLTYTTLEQDYFNELKSEAKSNNLKNLKTGILENGGIYNDLLAANFVIRFSTSRLPDGFSVYTVKLFNKSYYYSKIAQ